MGRYRSILACRSCGGRQVVGDGHVEASYVGSHLADILGKPWTAHSLRHRYATTTYEATHDLLLVQRLLGHASVRTTQIYVALPDARLRAGLDAVRLAV